MSELSTNIEKTPKMLAAEAEFGGDIKDIIQDFREVGGGNSWYTVADILGVHVMTLKEWRRKLGMKLDEQDRVYGPLHQPPKPANHLDFRVQKLGYKNAGEAVRHCRKVLKLTVEETCKRLGCSHVAVWTHSTRDMLGLRNYSERWHEYNRRRGAE